MLYLNDFTINLTNFSIKIAENVKQHKKNNLRIEIPTID